MGTSEAACWKNQVIAGKAPLIPFVGQDAVSRRSSIEDVRSATERRELLKAVYEEARGCTRCPLHQTRTNVVFGAGNADADLMFVGEAPGANEDRMGLPFVGQAGKLLDKLLGEIGLAAQQVFIANTSNAARPRTAIPIPTRSSPVRTTSDARSS